MASMNDLSSAVIDTPVTTFGKSIPQTTQKVVIYRGEHNLRYFLYKNGADPQGMRQFLILNRVGRAFDMEVGIQVQLPPTDTYKRHPDSNP